jgi:hypothetical protein
MEEFGVSNSSGNGGMSSGRGLETTNFSGCCRGQKQLGLGGYVRPWVHSLGTHLCTKV